MTGPTPREELRDRADDLREAVATVLDDATRLGVVVPVGWRDLLDDALADLVWLLGDPPRPGVEPGSSAEVYP